MIYKMTDKDKELENGEYEIWCDNAILVEMEIVTKTQGIKNCWLMKAEYILPLDKYKAIYKAYAQ